MTDHEGRPIDPDEPDDAVIKVWQVTPHPQTRDYDYMLCRSWQEMLDIVSNNLDTMLDGELPVTVTFNLVEMRKSEYLESIE